VARAEQQVAMADSGSSPGAMTTPWKIIPAIEPSGFAGYYRLVFLRPRRAFEALAGDNRQMRLALAAYLVPAVLYTLVYVFLVLGDGRPFRPWLAIAPEDYYRYNVFFCAPSMLLGLVLAAGVVRLLGRLFNADGSFEALFVVFCFGAAAASWATGLHDVLTSFLGAAGVIDQQAYEAALNAPTVWRALLWLQMGAYLVWFVALFGKGVQAVCRTPAGVSYLLGALGFLVYQGFFLIFNR
jgi:hypothetical protein